MSTLAQSRKYRTESDGLRILRAVDAEPPAAPPEPSAWAAAAARADPPQPPDDVLAIVPDYELPTARQVVGRGLELALAGAADIRRASLFTGLLVAAVAGPAAILLIAAMPTLVNVPWDDLYSMTVEQAVALDRLIFPLYVAGSLAALGTVGVLVDGQLIVASLLAARLAGAPLRLREGLARARQVFWRYGAAAFAVGLLSTVTTLVVNLVIGSGRGASLGSDLFGTLVGTVATAPFGYVLMGVVAGDVGSVLALRRSITLARARPALAAVVAAFAFLSSAFTVLGLGVALDVVSDVLLVLSPDVRLESASLVVAAPIALIALVAYGSLTVTVAAIAAAPQVAAFLGLTHYAAGIDRARTRAVPASPGRPVRWVTIPMLLLIGLEAVVVLAGLSRR
jgi:hypothetical protein